ncbi:MAG: hypothetical protein ACE37K_11450 [Planctomycetota bacterium]
MQGSGHIKVSATAVPGGTIQVQVGSGVSTVEVSLGGAGDTKSFNVPDSGSLSVPVPAGATGGMVVAVSIGKGLAKKIILVEILSTSP